MAAHTHALPVRSSRAAGLAAEACSHKSAKMAENLEITYQWLGSDGGTEP